MPLISTLRPEQRLPLHLPRRRAPLGRDLQAPLLIQAMHELPVIADGRHRRRAVDISGHNGPEGFPASHFDPLLPVLPHFDPPSQRLFETILNQLSTTYSPSAVYRLEK